MRRLPPLRSLEAFVRIAKLGSAKAAASELALSPPALSRRIKALEDFMGKPVFDRKAQAMVLNADGQALLLAIEPALEAMADAIDDLSGQGGEYRLRLGVLPLFGTQRLIPRLPELRKLFPKLHIDVDTSAHAENLLGDVVDAAIIIADQVDPRLYSVRLDRNNVYAITSHDLATSAKLGTPADLKNQTVLVHSDMPLIFDAWRNAVGQPKLKPAAIDHIDSGPLMLEAAANGLGVAIMHGSHLTDAKDDRLTRLFDVEVESPYSYWFVCRPRALKQRAVRIFHDWLVKSEI
ncbi:MAG: LysR family transcriptional regulator [Sphingomonadales bacterium]|jgi:LysR family glycine cleavage system transcriptional activator|uniref:LysR substrate-binding domain-containing protein n=1 Tax=Sphingorhabdus sp. TaxID=1902408 RepID=UPI003BAEFC93|nr:LysR family transcriptional regulator [Sphingomonadales bacterium]MBL0022514.1 LysR family transcriptional regulator [Sphingomonadales bacterium]